MLEKAIIQLIDQAARDKVTELDFSNTQLATLPPDIGQLSHLRVLNLSNTKLTSLPPDIGRLATLKKLDLRGTPLTTLPPDIGQLANLTELGLSDTQLPDLPPEISQLSRLAVLYLMNTKITALPPEIGQLSNLVVLFLSGNRLATLPPEFFQLSNLKILHLSGSHLSEIPPEINRLTNLTILSFKETQLKHLPAELFHLSNLSRLAFSDTQLAELPPDIGRLAKLARLYLSNTPLTALPPEIGRLTELKILNLRNTRLTSLPEELFQLTHLEELHLGGTQLTRLPPEIAHLSNLIELGLSGTPLTELPPEIGQLVNLNKLFLSHTRLTALPLQISHLTNLAYLGLQNTPLRTPPLEIAARGLSDVIDFLDDLAADSATRFEAKLLLVGEGGTGKSSLLRALRREPFAEGLSTTHGIDIQPYHLPCPDRPDETITLNVWDFGGQQIYHTTHQFFMTKRSLYVLVWNARMDTDQARLDHWLRNIQVLAPNAPVLLVATHIDERPEDFNYARYKATYPQLVGHVGVSNKTGAGIEELRHLLAQEAAKLPLMEQQWPTTWCNAEEALRDQPDHHLSRADYTDLCIRQGVNAEIAQTALGGYLHDLGKILYYQDDDLLSDFVVLKPNWLTEAISRVLDDETTRNSGGLLAHADFPRLWADYDRSLYPRFLRLMEKFLISYKLAPANPHQPATHSMVPLLFSHRSPADMPPWAEVLPGRPEINMVFRLEGFTPPGLMSWFIVLTHPYTQHIHWREGVRLQYEGHQAEVVLNPSTHELWLRVRGPSPYNFFNILHHTINQRVLGFYAGLNYKRLVPCNCHLERGDETDPCPYYHDYQSLVARMERGRLTAECDRSFEQVSVPMLLYGIHYTTNDRVVAKLDEIHTAVEQGRDEIVERLIELSQGYELLRRDFSRLWNYEMAELEAECPNTFVLLPGSRGGVDPGNLFNTRYDLYLMCQHPGGPHIVEGEKGYSVLQSKEWWAQLAPWLKRVADYLKYIPKVRGLAEAYDKEIFKDIERSLDIFEEVLDNIPEEIEAHDQADKLPGARSLFEVRETTGPALRLLHSFLKKVDAKQHWCGLRKTVTHDGNILWLCAAHEKFYKM